MKETLNLEQIKQLLADSGLSEMIVWAIPVMLSLVVLEWVLGIFHNREVYDKKDLLASMAVGIGNLIVSAISKTTIFALALVIYNWVPWSVPYTWWSFVVCLIWLDFWRYISHRVSHENRFWWATHVVHHSSLQYNFAVSFRLSWVQQLKFIFFIPVLLVGFHPVVMFICHQIEVLYQFWIHTEFIKKLPRPIEYVFVTPSHHRVHHACDEKYLDKNYGSTFIIWDRMFGTFQPEEETPTYGITKPVGSYNPAYLVFHEFIDIVNDIRQSKSFKEAWERAFIRPSRLAQLEAKYAKENQALLEKKEEVPASID